MEAQSCSPRVGLFIIVLWLVLVLCFLWSPYYMAMDSSMFLVKANVKEFRLSISGHNASNPTSHTWIVTDEGSKDDVIVHQSTGNPNISTILSSKDNVVAPLSTGNPNIPTILQEQKKRLHNFCATHNMSLPEISRTDIPHHIIVDDTRKILFCYIPKVACSNWKRVFLLLAGKVDPARSKRPSIEVLRDINTLEKYSPEEQEYRLRNYFKFMFVRYPPDRILSAFRNKLEFPLQPDQIKQNLWEKVRYLILKPYRKNFELNMAKEKEVYPAFSEYIHYLYDSKPGALNEHFKPMVELCRPCTVDYDFVGNFGNLRNDANMILDHLNINQSFFWDRGQHNDHPTHSYIKEYYSPLQPSDYLRLEKKFKDDIAFYEYLFPTASDPDYQKLRNTKLLHVR